MASAAANGIAIEYDTAGNPDHPPLLLVMGLGMQLIAWTEELVDAFVRQGFYVVRFDNRDVGLSTWFDDAGIPDLATAFGGGAVAPYLLSDMADDAAGLLDALGIEAAHVLGASMGGMIVQSLAIGHPDRVLTMTSIMSTTGDRLVGAPHPEGISALLAAPPADRDDAIEASARLWKIITSPGFAFDEERVRADAAAAYDRAFHPAGTARQLAAIVASPDRTPALRGVRVPTLVIHGEADILVDPSGGRATADTVPGAELWTVPGMGHHLPPEMYDEIALRVAARSRNREIN
jgi:pimeloyl-ACP methyl ester carboxylesterase